MPSGTKRAPEALALEISARLREHMARRKISKSALAGAVGISEPQVNKMINGRKDFDIEDLDRICWALGLDLREVINAADEASTSRHIAPGWNVTPLTR